MVPNLSLEVLYLGTICLSLIVPNLLLKVIYLIVGGSKLIREFLGDLSGLLEVSLTRVSHVVNQLKNSIPRLVYWIVFRTRTLLFRSKRNNSYMSHHTPQPYSQPGLSIQIPRQRSCCARKHASSSLRNLQFEPTARMVMASGDHGKILLK
jgi:hypothetical protein